MGSLSKIFSGISFGEFTTVVSRSHDFTVCPCRTDGKKVSPVTSVQVECLDEYIARLADRTYHVVGFFFFVAADVFYQMERLIERPDGSGRSCGIHNGKLFMGGFV